MIRILLIRHGNTDLLGRVLYGRMPDVHLNDDGRMQAETLARELKARYRINEVVSSPLDRALETARPIADAQHLGITIDEGVNELDFGSWMGKPFTELVDTQPWKLYNQLRATSKPSGGESMIEVQARAWSGVERITARFSDTPDTTVALVTHGDVIRALLILLLGMSLDRIHRVEVAPASVSELLLGPGEPLVRNINRTFSEE